MIQNSADRRVTVSEEDLRMLATPATRRLSEKDGHMLRVRRPSISEKFELSRTSPIPGLSRGGARIKVSDEFAHGTMHSRIIWHIK
jgi:hypothetical protein